MINLNEISYINIHTHYLHKQPGTLGIIDLDLFETDEIEADGSLYTIGLHPWFLEDILPGDPEKLKQFTRHPSVVAIGEAGLDKTCDTPYPLQRKYFVDQIELSEKLGKPMMIHCVKAWPELITIHKILKPKVPWIVHGFSSSIDVRDQLLAAGMYLSFGRAILNPESKTIKVLPDVPLDHLFLETDDSAVEMEKIYQQASELKGISEDELIAAIKDNFRKCFPFI
jgi:TatD DNase family protein